MFLAQRGRYRLRGGLAKDLGAGGVPMELVAARQLQLVDHQPESRD